MAASTIGQAYVYGTWILIIAGQGALADTDSFGADVAGGASILIIAVTIQSCRGTSGFSVAAIFRTRVTVIAGERAF